MPSQTSHAAVPLLDFLSKRETQARGRSAPYLRAVPDENSMLYWLARACTIARESSGRLQVHVAASLDVNQSTIDRFEEGEKWPRSADRTIAGYAEDISTPDHTVEPIELWAEALRLWQEHLSAEAAAEVKRGAEALPTDVPNVRSPKVSSGKPRARGQRASRATNGAR